MKSWLYSCAVVVLICLPTSSWAQRKQARGVPRHGMSPARSTSAHVEPVRTMRGSMLANVITARTSDNDQPGFDYTITGARVSEGRLELQGTIGSATANTGQVSTATATLIGTLAKHRPVATGDAARATTPGASPAASGQARVQQQGREPTNPENAAQLGQLSQATQTTAQATHPPTVPGGKQPAGTTLTEQITEAPVQTRALATATSGVTGCEVMFLKIQLPSQLKAKAGGSNEMVQLGVVLVPLDNKTGDEINQRMCRIVRALDSKAGSGEVDDELTRLNRLLGSSR
jgi:hypothetical protein